jgi:hypothetical protein
MVHPDPRRLILAATPRLRCVSSTLRFSFRHPPPIIVTSRHLPLSPRLKYPVPAHASCPALPRITCHRSPGSHFCCALPLLVASRHLAPSSTAARRTTPFRPGFVLLGARHQQMSLPDLRLLTASHVPLRLSPSVCAGHHSPQPTKPPQRQFTPGVGRSINT